MAFSRTRDSRGLNIPEYQIGSSQNVKYETVVIPSTSQVAFGASSLFDFKEKACLINEVISGNKIGTTIYGATNVTGANSAGEVMANLTVSPANSVWLVSYSFAFYSSNSAYPATSACNVYIRNDSGSSPQIFGITNFPNGSILTTWNDQCAVITVGSTTSSNNFKLQHTIAASGTIQWLFLNFWGTRIA